MRASRLIFLCLIGALLVAIPSLSVHASEAEELPNLVPLPAFDIGIKPESSRPRAPVALRFAAATANRADFALDLFGQPDQAGSTSVAAAQCVDWATDRMCAARETVGRFLWHPEHGHYHFEDFALYELRRFRSDGQVNFKPKGLVATSGKVSFCVIDVEQDRRPSSALYAFPYPLYYSCAAGAGFQGISPGWRDVYAALTPGQEFPLDKLIPGRLALVIYSDPADRLREMTNDDNISVAGIDISEDLTEVEVFCTSEPGSSLCSHPAPPSDTP